MIYPRICPAVIVAVRHGDKLLVSKYAGREYKNIALLAGFAEVGETIEETVHREVMEEVGIRVKNLQFYKSQPCCSLASSATSTATIGCKSTTANWPRPAGSTARTFRKIRKRPA